jgi:hypothetical protein
MRHTHTFLLTVLYDERERLRLRGRLRAVNQDGEKAFATTEELLDVLYSAIQAGPAPAPGEAGAHGEPGNGT